MNQESDILMEEAYSNYDPFAWFYNKYWSREISGQILNVIDRLLVPRLPARARILDLCCGTGQIAAALTERGFAVTGLDRSPEMLRYAQQNAPAAQFILADARSFELPSTYEGIISNFDSLNHVMSLQDLTMVFRNVHRALAPTGFLLFDMNMEQGFLLHWRDYFAMVEADGVCVLRGKYDPEEKTGRYDITLFRQEGERWQRADAVICERCYSIREIKLALKKAGFKEVSTYDAAKDLGLVDHTGRTFFLIQQDSQVEN